MRGGECRVKHSPPMKPVAVEKATDAQYIVSY
jgi:hypothetical protein